MSERTTQQLVDRLNSSDPDFDDCTDAAIILLRQHAEIERLKRERQHIYDLLARIHRDGGQYTAEHGVEKSCDDAEAQVVTWLDTISGVDAPRWRDVVDELPKEAQEVLFVRGGKVVHGAWIGGIFWHSNQKMAAAQWMPIPAPPKVGAGSTAT